MVKTDKFITSMIAHGLVDDALTLDNGYDIQYKGNIVSVRLNGKGGAVIFNKNRNDVVEVQSGRLDDVLHRYIINSLFGIQSKTGTRDVEYKDVFFVPTKVIQNSVVFEDSVGRRFTVSGSTPKAVLSFYNEMVDVNADDCMILLSGFKPYDRPEGFVKSAKEPEIELQLLKCSLDIDDYAVCAKSECIHDVGQTLVGNFLCSSADKISQITFEEDVKKVFSSTGVSKKNINSSVVRVSNPFAMRAKVALKSATARKAVKDYLDSKYPDGLCVSALEQVMAYETPSIFKAANIDEPLNYKNLFSDYLRNCDTVSFRLDSNKSLLVSTNVPGKSVAKFRSVPEVSTIKNALQKEGYLLSELSDGLEFKSTNPAVAAIVNACKNFVPVSERMNGPANTVSKVIGSACAKLLSEYGIEDKKGVFSSIVSIVNN